MPITEFSVRNFSGLEKRERYIQEISQLCREYFWSCFPEQVWHYTSIESLTAILKSKSLWLTHVSDLNDPNEVKSSASALDGILETYLRDQSLPPRIRVLYESARSQLMPDPKNSPWFAFSTSAARDDSAQWYRYADNEKGVAIGFNPKQLLAYFGNPPHDYPLIAPVEYDRQKIIEFFCMLVSVGKENFIRDYSHIDDSTLAAEAFLIDWGQHVNHLSVATKLPGWISEQEWRIAKSLNWNATHSDDLFDHNGRRRWRVTKGVASVHQANQLPIDQVMLGPNCSRIKSEVQALLFEHGIGGIEVKISSLGRR